MFEFSSGKALLASASVTGLVALSACGSAGADREAAPGEVSGEVQVFAAASLNGAGAQLEKAFQEEHPGVDISINYAGSSKLVQQMEQGATPDLLITADQKTMDAATASVPDLTDAKVQAVATNRLVLVTAADNPAGVESVKDLQKSNVTTALCAAEVPCGNLAHQELENQSVEPSNATEEQNVSEVATKVSTGAVDTGFVYSTDAAALKKNQNIVEIELPDLENNVYPMALTSRGAQNSAAEEFSQWLTEETAQKILAEYGFGSPTSAE